MEFFFFLSEVSSEIGIDPWIMHTLQKSLDLVINAAYLKNAISSNSAQDP